jgi:hypothetical protein
MPTPNYRLIICLIFLAGTILVRTVAIAQHAYNVVLLPPSVSLMAAVVSPNTPNSSAIVDAHLVENPRLVEYHSSDGVTKNAPDADFSAKRERPAQIASERHQKKVALRRHHRFDRNGFAFHRPWTLWW